MFPLAGMVFLVDLLSLIDVPPLLQYLAFGIVFGTAVGKTVVVRRERRCGELHPEEIRHIELVWVATGVSLTVLAVVAQVALILL